MKLKLIFVLVFLNIVVFGAIYYLERRIGDEPGEFRNHLIGAAIKDVDRLEIKGKGLEEPFVVECSNNRWQITSPVNWPANLFAIQRIITQLQFLEPEVSFSVAEMEDSGQSLAEYGLDEPNILLTFYSGDVHQSLAVGKPTHLGNRVYVLSGDGKEVHVIKQVFLDSLSMSLDALCNQEVFNIPFYELNTLSVQLYSPHNLKIRLVREGDQWKFEAPIQVSANSTLVNNAIHQLMAINVKRFVFDKTPAWDELGLHSPTMRVTIEGNSGRQTLLIGNMDKEGECEGDYYYAHLEDSPTILTVSAEPFIALKEAQAALREKHFVSVDFDKLNNVTISQSSKTVNLQKLEGGKWEIFEKDVQGHLLMMGADDAVMKGVLEQVQNLEAVAFVSDAPSSADLELFGFNDPQRIICLEGASSETLIVGAFDEQGEYTYAKLKDAPYVYKVHPTLLNMLPVSTLHYQDRSIRKLPQGAYIQSLKLTNVADQAVLFEKTFDIKSDRAEGMPSLLNKEQNNALASIVENLREFKVQSYLKKQFTSNVELDSEKVLPWLYRLQAKVFLSGSESNDERDDTLEFYFTERVSGNLQIGGSPQDNSLFRLNQQWIDDLYTLTSSVDHHNIAESGNGDDRT